MHLLAQVEDEAEWVAGPYDDDVDHDEEGAYGVEAMCRLVAALHAKATMPTALELVTKVCIYAHLSCRVQDTRHVLMVLIVRNTDAGPLWIISWEGMS